ncbi:hypothetical protein IPZ58_29435 [Streptomyces roseoverticillatus]|uniref:DUF6542 domain-containing protein n=1 Tax=Streptomyces roseoverticillatus TaxID=66429 RepID=UPI001F3D2723|nr:DUF6542 domain-containing protein [Streptomyces roseoverticillatus]MCF3105688.1 hypothetical protein [Streptomyces roseoverticillatus]
MEQPSTRTPRGKARRVPPVPRPAAPVGQGAAAGLRRPRGGPSAAQLRGLGRLPAPRLTGLGSGLLTTLWMLGTGWLDSRAGGSPGFYGICFLLAGTVCALWVRPADLATAPVAAPIAFAVGAVPLVDAGSGVGSRVMGLVTLLSLNAGWLYAGTLLTALVALTRRIALVRRRKQARLRRLQRQRPSRPPRSPHCSPAQQARSRR